MVSLKAISSFQDNKGSFVPLVNSEDLAPSLFTKAYISIIKPNVSKGFYKHSGKNSNLICLKGHIKFYYIDNGVLESIILSSPIKEVLTIEPGTWYGWTNYSPGDSWLLNVCCIDIDNVEERLDFYEVYNGFNA